MWVSWPTERLNSHSIFPIVVIFFSLFSSSEPSVTNTFPHTSGSQWSPGETTCNSRSSQALESLRWVLKQAEERKMSYEEYCLFPTLTACVPLTELRLFCSWLWELCALCRGSRFWFGDRDEQWHLSTRSSAWLSKHLSHYTCKLIEKLQFESGESFSASLPKPEMKMSCTFVRNHTIWPCWKLCVGAS